MNSRGSSWRRAALPAVLGLLVRGALCAAPENLAPPTDQAAVEGAVRVLTALPSRVTGASGSQLAFEYLRSSLENLLGTNRVTVQEFEVTVPAPTEPGRLFLAGEVFELDAVWPNAAVPPNAGAEGIEGFLLHAESVADLDGEELHGAIVLQELSSADLWVRLAGMGVGAVVFLPPADFERAELERTFISAPLSFPRFLLRDPDAAERLRIAARDRPPVLLRGGLRWTKVKARNIVGLLPGSDPELARERLILSAYYDAISVVPTRAPGAEAAANAAALLETARWFAAASPRRTVLFVFTDAHFLGMSGAANFVRWFSNANTGGGHRQRLMALPLEESMLRDRLPKLESLAERFADVEAVTNLVGSVRESLASKPAEEARIRREIEVLAIPEFSTAYDAAQARVAAVEGVRGAFRDMGVLKDALNDLRQRIRDLRMDPELRDQPGVGREIARSRAARAEILELQKEFRSTPTLDAARREARRARPRAPLFRRISERERARERSPVLFMGFDITSGAPKIGLFARGSYEDNRDVYRQREYVPLGRAIRARIIGDPEVGLPGIGDALGAPPATLFAETITGQRGMTAESYFTEPFAFESELVSMAVPAVTLATCGDARRRVNTPDDTPDALDYDHLDSAVRTASTIAMMVANDPEVDLRIYERHRLYPTIRGRSVRLEQARSLIADTPVPGAVMMIRPERGSRGAYLRGFPKPLYGIHAGHVTIADESGNYAFPGFLWTAGAELSAFLIDEETGRVVMAHDLGGEGNRKYNFHRLWVPGRAGLSVSAVLFDCAATALVDLVDPRYLLTLQFLQVMDGRTDAEPQFFGYSLPMVPRFDASYIEPCVVVFTRPESRFKLTMSLGLMGRRLVLVNAATPLTELGFALRQYFERAEMPEPGEDRGLPFRETREGIERLFERIIEADADELLRDGIVPLRPREVESLRTALAAFRGAAGELEARTADRGWRERRVAIERGVTEVVEEHRGSTYGFEPVHGVKPWVAEHVARDLWFLNEERLATLARHGIASEYLAGMHRDARRALDRAEASRHGRRWTDYIASAADAWALSSRVYPDVIQTSNDVVKGVIFYLAMTLPFAFFGERLVFAFADIRARIAGVVGIFLAVLVLLSIVHPAFAITMTPLLIFLGFVIITLAVVVTSLVMSKFNRELHRIKSGMVALRYTDVNRFGAAMTAFNLGVSYMRRRRMKTGLTCVALILLTFTVISFVSVQGYLRLNRYPLPWEGAYRGVLYRNLDWSPLEEPEYRRFRATFEPEFDVAARAWLTGPRPEEYLAMEIASAADPTLVTEITGAVGLEPAETRVTEAQRALAAGRWFEEGDAAVCILPDRLAETLGIAPEDVGTAAVRLFGQQLKVIGLLRSDAQPGLPGWDDIVDLNDDPLTPASFIVRRAEQFRRDEATGTTTAALEEYDYLPTTAMALLPFHTLLARGGTMRSIAARPSVDMDLGAFVERLLRSWSLAIYVSEEEGRRVTLYNSIGASALTGTGGMAIPLVIAGLIIFNTMLGSVYERQKEIHTYSSVGLSPVHISSLFIAESCVYAVLGAISGYLMGQAVAFLLTQQGWLAGLTLNYSSTSTFMAVAIVMTVTIASSLYPASLAHRLATPDIARTWQIGEPRGDRWQLDLPFIIERDQILPFNAYLADYFRAHREESVGHFCAEQVAFEERGAERHPRLAFRCRLAPYDFGVQQDVQLDSVPSDVIDGKLTFLLTINRITGEDAAWRRTNREFFNRLRKTILLWRVLPEREKTMYYERTADMLSGRIEADEDL